MVKLKEKKISRYKNTTKLENLILSVAFALTKDH